MNYKPQVDKATANLDFEGKDYQVVVETNHGTIRLNLWPDVAPGHCRNMIGLANCGFYDGLGFHRIISGFMIQGGCPEGRGTGGPGYQIPAEFNKRPHIAGVLSRARSNNPNSAGSQFFICLGTHSYLDGQYTAFGETADAASLDVVKKIGSLATDSQDRPKSPAQIVKVTVNETAKA